MSLLEDGPSMWLFEAVDLVSDQLDDDELDVQKTLMAYVDGHDYRTRAELFFENLPVDRSLYRALRQTRP